MTEVFQSNPEYIKQFFNFSKFKDNQEKNYSFLPTAPINPKLFESIILNQIDLVNKLTVVQSKILSNYYPSPEFGQIINRIPDITQENWQKRELRIKVQIPSLLMLKDKKISGKIMDISPKGFKFECNNPEEELLEKDSDVEVHIELNTELFILLRANIRWVKEGSYGMRVLLPVQYYFRSKLIQTADFFEELLLKESNFFSQLTMGQIQILLNYCPNSEFAHVLEQIPEYSGKNWKKRDFRAEVAMRALITNGVNPVIGRILNVSNRGFKFIAEPQAQLEAIQNKVLEIHIELNSKITTMVKGRVQWNKENVHGVKIETPSSSWLEMIDTLNKNFS